MAINCAADSRLKPLVNTQEARRAHAQSKPISPITSIPTSPFITQARTNAGTAKPYEFSPAERVDWLGFSLCKWLHQLGSGAEFAPGNALKCANVVLV